MQTTVHQTEMLLFFTLLQLAVIVLAARAAGEIAVRLSQSRAVGEIIAGLMLGPSLLGLLSPDTFNYAFRSVPAEPMNILSQIGLILLMFQIGLEFDFGHLKTGRNREAVLQISVMGVALPFMLGLMFGWISHPYLATQINPLGYILFIGTAFSITALPVLGRILMELDLTQSRVGVIAIGSAAINDVIGWLMLAAVTALTLAQSFTASVRGVVTDASHSAIPGAKVTVTDVDRNASQKVTTDAAGRYVFTALPPGNYSLGVESAGFSKYSRAAFPLQVQQQATIDVELSVDAIATTVSVEAAATLLNTTSATLGQVVENKYILSLPLAGRAPLSLVALTPGLTPSNLNPGGQSNTNFTANGNRNSSADVLVDGMSVANVEQNSGITNLEYQPSVDAAGIQGPDQLFQLGVR